MSAVGFPEKGRTVEICVAQDLWIKNGSKSIVAMHGLGEYSSLQGRDLVSRDILESTSPPHTPLQQLSEQPHISKFICLQQSRSNSPHWEKRNQEISSFGYHKSQWYWFSKISPNNSVSFMELSIFLLSVDFKAIWDNSPLNFIFRILFSHLFWLGNSGWSRLALNPDSHNTLKNLLGDMKPQSCFKTQFITIW